MRKNNRHTKNKRLAIIQDITKRAVIIILLLFLFMTTYFIARYLFSSTSSKYLSSGNVSASSVTPFSSATLGAPTTSAIGTASSPPASQPSPLASALPAAPNLSFGAYMDDFPNAVYIDGQRTSLYRDDIATAVIFPPDYTWQDASSASLASAQSYFSNLTLNNFNGPYNDRRCLANDCLVQSGNALYYNGRTLKLPSEIRTADIAAISISALNKRWLVGATIKEGNSYRGRVYYFDGSNFSEVVTPNPVLSPYFGLWGFGGDDSDFLMIYGAYQGIAYRVRANNITNISNFFSIRAMNNGFKAEVIRAVKGSEITWYVYSSTLNRPWLIKLWQNFTPDIVGETFFPDLFAGGAQSVVFKLLKIDPDSISLLAKVDNVGQASGKIFIDRGFKNTKVGVLVTIPLGNYGANSGVMIRKISEATLNLDASSRPSVQYLFSSDGQNWRPLIGTDNSDFLAPAASYYLKVIFPAAKNKFYSPYLDSILFDYYWAKPDETSLTSPAANSSSSNSSVSNNSTNSVGNPVNFSNDVPKAGASGVSGDSFSAETAPIIPTGAISIKVSASGFSPGMFTVKSGESVTLALTASDNNAHIFVFPNASMMNLTTMVFGGDTKIITFIAPAAGVYDFRDDIPDYRGNCGQMVVK